MKKLSHSNAQMSPVSMQHILQQMGYHAQLLLKWIIFCFSKAAIFCQASVVPRDDIRHRSSSNVRCDLTADTSAIPAIVVHAYEIEPRFAAFIKVNFATNRGLPHKFACLEVLQNDFSPPDVLHGVADRLKV